MGSFSWSTTKQALIIDYAARRIENDIYTPSQLARAYLDIAFPRILRTTSAQYTLFRLGANTARPAPYFARVTHDADLVYLDLKGAYWQIMSAVGWDVDYYPNKFVGFGRSLADFPFSSDKLTRNMLASAGLKTSIMTWDGKALRQKKMPNRHANGVLWNYIQDVLHAIALDMVEIGAVYVAVDGYIVPRENLRYAEAVLQAWGMLYSVKYSGIGSVYAPTDYEFPDKPRRKTGREFDFNNLKCLADLSWLRKKHTFAIDMRRRLKR